MADPNDDADRVTKMSEEERRIFEHDMDVFVTMLEIGSFDFEATEKLVNKRRREDRRLEREWHEGEKR